MTRTTDRPQHVAHLLAAVDFAMSHPQVRMADLEEHCGVRPFEAKRLLADLTGWGIVSEGQPHAARRPIILPGHRELVRRVVLNNAEGPPDPNPLAAVAVPGITETGRRVLDLLAEGLEAPEVGARLHLSKHTVKTHERRMRRDLQARNRAHLVSLAYQWGHLPNPYKEVSGKDSP